MNGKRLENRVVVVTGGAGLLGIEHARAVLSEGGTVVSLDLDLEFLQQRSNPLIEEYGEKLIILKCDITDEESVVEIANRVKNTIGNVSGLINNAALNPSVEKNSHAFTRVESISYQEWTTHLDVGLFGAFVCSKIFGLGMIESLVDGSIINISSDHGLISPNQNLYRIDGLAEHEQPVKPIMYSVVKHGLIGMTHYFATYWSRNGIRVNTLCPGGVLNGQSEVFLNRFNDLVPLGRPAYPFEYQGAIIFLLSDESSYMTGASLVMDGGRSIW